MQAMAPTLFMLYVSRDVDWLDGHNVMALRLLFAGSIVLQLVAGLLVWLRVRAAADRRPVALPPASPEAPPVNTTVHDFDVGEVRKLAQSVVGNAAFLAFLNYKFDMAMPVYFQVFMGLFRIYDWEMFRIHVLRVWRTRGRRCFSYSISPGHCGGVSQPEAALPRASQSAGGADERIQSHARRARGTRCCWCSGWGWGESGGAGGRGRRGRRVQEDQIE
jgi:hypothetical protein